MCIICVKNKGVALPTKKVLETMFNSNPDGAGYMFVRNIDGDEFVHIRKGFMTFEDLMDSLENDNLTAADSVIYHFRITTQGGVQQKLCHPYPLSEKMDDLKRLRCKCKLGVAHNGIIRLTSDGAADYNDTMLFITSYMSQIIKTINDFYSSEKMAIIEELAQSKFALLLNNGDIKTIGQFNKDYKTGLLFSNYTWIDYASRYFNSSTKTHKYYSQSCKKWFTW